MAWKPPEHDLARKLRDHLPERQWRTAIGEICVRHGVEHRDLSSFASGSDVVWGAGRWVIKLTAPLWRSEIETEARCLRQVHGQLAVETPEVLATGELAGWPYVVMRRVSGVAIGSIWRDVTREERLRLAGELGRLARFLHGLDCGRVADGWVPFWGACRRNVGRRHAEPEVPQELSAAVDPFLESVGELVCEPRGFLHTELLDQHVLVEERAGHYEPSALIDFADSRIGPIEYEFPAPVEFLFKGEPGILRAFLIAYGIPGEELTPERSQRMLAWALSHRFGRLRRMLEAVLPARPTSLPELARTLFGLD